METAIAEITTSVESGAVDTKPEETAGEGSAPSVPKADTSEDTSSWTEKAQKRYDELTRKAYEAQGERDRERYQREALQAQLAELQKAKTEQVAPDNFPTLEQICRTLSCQPGDVLRLADETKAGRKQSAKGK